MEGERRDLGPPAGLEHVEAELRARMSDGHAYALIAEIVAWKEKALADARDEALVTAYDIVMELACAVHEKRVASKDFYDKLIETAVRVNNKRAYLAAAHPEGKHAT